MTTIMSLISYGKSTPKNEFFFLSSFFYFVIIIFSRLREKKPIKNFIFKNIYSYKVYKKVMEEKEFVRLSVHESEIALLKTKLSELHRGNKERESGHIDELKQLNAEITGLKHQVATYEIEREDLIHSHKTLSSDSMDQLISLRKLVQEQKEVISVQSEKLLHNQHEFQNILSSLESLEEQLSTMKYERDNAVKKMSRWETLFRNREALRLQNTELMSSLEQLRRQLAEETSKSLLQAKEQMSMNAKIMEENARLLETRRILLRDSERQDDAGLKEINQRLKEENERLSSELKSCRNRVSASARHEEQLKEHNQELQMRIDRQKSHYVEEVENLQRRCSSLQSELGELKKQRQQEQEQQEQQQKKVVTRESKQQFSLNLPRRPIFASPPLFQDMYVRAAMPYTPPFIFPPHSAQHPHELWEEVQRITSTSADEKRMDTSFDEFKIDEASESSMDSNHGESTKMTDDQLLNEKKRRLHTKKAARTSKAKCKKQDPITMRRRHHRCSACAAKNIDLHV